MTLDLTTDTLYHGVITLQQPANGYRVGLDAMLLAGCVTLKNGQTVLELGCGVGAVLHALAHRARSDAMQVAFTGIELQPEMANLARSNAIANNFALAIVDGDVTDKQLLATLGTFDQVICNPPYHPAHASPSAAHECRTTAHMEVADGLANWLQAANRFLKPKGTLTMIHRADRLHEYLPLCAKFLGDLTVIPFWPKAGEPAKRVIVTGRKGARGGLTMHPGLVLHDSETGHHTPEAETIVGRGEIMPV